jgi:hypothetical protein
VAVLLAFFALASAPHACSSHGLAFSYQQGGATYGNTVTTLRASNISCTTARTMARTIALDLLHGRPAPARLGGLAVKVVQSCPGCAPHTTVTASAGRRKVTFVVAAGR